MCSNTRCEQYNMEDDDLCEDCHKKFMSKRYNSLICTQCNTIYLVRKRWKDESEASINGLCGACNHENELRREEYLKKNPHLRKDR